MQHDEDAKAVWGRVDKGVVDPTKGCRLLRAVIGQKQSPIWVDQLRTTPILINGKYQYDVHAVSRELAVAYATKFQKY